MAGKLVLCRHGQSEWNLENKFTGWEDVGLTPLGEEEALEAGRQLKAIDINFDIAFTSLLKRANKTLFSILEQMDLTWIPITHAWELNERHYGALQGKNKAEVAKEFGDEQVHIGEEVMIFLPHQLIMKIHHTQDLILSMMELMNCHLEKA